MEKVSVEHIMDALRKNNPGPRPLAGEGGPASAGSGEGRAQATDAQIHNGSGIAFAAARVALLEKLDSEIGMVILNHRGRENAIKIDAIRGMFPNLDARRVKQAVENLRTMARLPVAATKEKPYGYFIPVTAEECRAMHDRMMREAIRLIRLSQLFERDADLVRTLEGQLQLQPVVIPIPQ